VLTAALAEAPAVALLGPRQVGKTTLALAVAETRPSLYLDLESEADRAKLAEPELYLGQHVDKLVILDEIQRAPQLFQSLRGLIDAGRRRGQGKGRFLTLGSASIDLLKQSSESLAGRIRYLELSPLDAGEAGRERLDALWRRGGFPESLLADSDAASLRWRMDFIRTYLERDIPQLGPHIASETLRRLWTMLAHAQGGLLNAVSLARSLAVDGKTVARYLDLLVDLMLVRRLAPWHGNVRKRLVKSPKVYVRDSGLVHALLGIADGEALLAHPVAWCELGGVGHRVADRRRPAGHPGAQALCRLWGRRALPAGRGRGGLPADRTVCGARVVVSRFAFLQREWAAVFESAARAEATVHADPRTAASTRGARSNWR
jgi:predicted AAA+ superfamily ATPase